MTEKEKSWFDKVKEDWKNQKVKEKKKNPFLKALNILFLVALIYFIFNSNQVINLFNQKTHVEESTFVIKGYDLNKVCWNSQEDIQVNAIIDSTKPVDIYFIHTSERGIFEYINNLEYNYYPSCSFLSILRKDITCIITGKGCLIISNLENSEDSQVTLKLSAINPLI